MILKNFLGNKPSDPLVSLDEADTNRLSYPFHICVTRLAHDKLSTFRIKVCLSFHIRATSVGGWGHTFQPKMKINDENMFYHDAEGHFLTF